MDCAYTVDEDVISYYMLIRFLAKDGSTEAAV